MATVVVQQQTIRHATPPPPSLGPAVTLKRTSSPVPNKHIPACPTGPSPARTLDSLVHAKSSLAKTASVPQTSSLLYPPDHFERISSALPVYSIDATTLHDALHHLAAQPLPDPNLMFPWLHGLHPDNHLQMAFFVNRKRSLRRPPKCWRGITLVKVGGDLSTAKLKGAVAVDEVLAPGGTAFVDADPTEGFSVRNFHIQTAKLAPMSDIIVYGDHNVGLRDLLATAEKMATAQQNWRLKHEPGQETPLFNTFIVSGKSIGASSPCSRPLTSPADSFEEIEKKYPDLVVVDSKGRVTRQVVDFRKSLASLAYRMQPLTWPVPVHCERSEMCAMSKASEISQNVWLGPTPDDLRRVGHAEGLPGDYDLYVEASDLASIPGPRQLAQLDRELANGPQRLEFPSSGSLVPTGDPRETDDLLATIRWLYYLANPEVPSPPPETDHAEGDIPMTSLGSQPRRILIHCTDGYTESTLLTLAYFMYAEGVPAHEAWLKLHCEKQRNFFAYPSDVSFLSSVQHRLLHESPAASPLHSPTRTPTLTHFSEPDWFRRMDGSLPSRILPYMYLGNLSHANNPDLLVALGIRRVLSIGEPVHWSVDDVRRFGEENLVYIGQVQDNGIDPLTEEFDRCLEFIRGFSPSVSYSELSGRQAD